MQSFGEHVSYHLISSTVLQFHGATAHLFPDEVVLDSDVFCSPVELWVFSHSNFSDP